MKPYILVTNDDGIDSPGIQALAKAMSQIGTVVVVAPDRQQSAVGHSLTISNPLRVTKFSRDGDICGYAVNGTPSDCVKMAISSLMPEKPALVISGINHGQNTGVNILYSGTVAAATEGMLFGIPSIAISLASHDVYFDCSAAAEYALRVAEMLMNYNLQKSTLLNVNVPALTKEKIKGVKVVKQSNSYWKDNYEKRNDPFGREYFWFAGEYNSDNSADTDDYSLDRGWVTITPVQFKFTDFDLIENIKSFESI